MSPIFDKGPRFYFMVKKGKPFKIVFLISILYFIKGELGPISRIRDIVSCM